MFRSSEVVIRADDALKLSITPNIVHWGMRFAERLIAAVAASPTIPAELHMENHTFYSSDNVRYIFKSHHQFHYFILNCFFFIRQASSLPSWLTNTWNSDPWELMQRRGHADESSQGAHFTDDLRILRIDRLATLNPRLGCLSFSSTPDGKIPVAASVQTARWMTWRYVSPRAVTQITLGSLVSLMQVSAPPSVSATPFWGEIFCRLSAFNDLTSTFDHVADLPWHHGSITDQSLRTNRGVSAPAGVPSAVSAIHAISRRVVAETWKIDWVGFADGIYPPSAQELGQLCRVDSMFHPAFVPSSKLNISVPVLSISISDIAPGGAYSVSTAPVSRRKFVVEVLEFFICPQKLMILCFYLILIKFRSWFV